MRLARARPLAGAQSLKRCSSKGRDMIRQFDYFWTLGRSILTPVRPAIVERRTALLVTTGVVLLVLVTTALRSPATALHARGGEHSNTERLLDRTRLVDASLRQVQLMYREEIEPLER